ncbi:zinc fingers and homeoboxes protein 3 [Megalops cyprinoides]|uniref:zinc fingers and homeoboxes protein 3 n=1 Tax=Megalops cyprinoides TaxID=118141 RepID=UPI00186422E8|nr:zinc fingers and homeoboxes protein 3 [Megalops cyprinoides]XP_036389996.1 zinc fingers and homeoboxes protein 3 [Megalops cyprinoides]XP_036389997.1 zinc fingers and homeoboxes protein 3 [Megalops cyprinoides]
MASKRKSTIPCMIPLKSMHLREEVEREGGLPDCLPHPGKDGVFPSVEDSFGQGSQELAESSRPEKSSVQQEGGTYTCRPCNFESQDLNLFLDHVYSSHADFRAEPSFYCLDCSVSTAKFEGLALHNARCHPSTAATTLQVKKRDRRTMVEQRLVTGEGSKESEISITKTPIMKMLKGKSEPKRIVVSHMVEESSLDSITSKEVEKKDTPMVTHVPTIVHNGAASKVTLPSAIQIVNSSGTLPVLKTAITQVVSMVQNRTLHQQSPIMASSTSTSSSRNLPKVMIPLSSIPTYNAAMDTNSFLKTSFSKFPYPTKAELCYLTVVTKYPEEQIKIWFTAQRLKQGISWSPEEIEDARRKMFNTIIQTAPSTPQQQPQPRQTHHNPAQHTITVLPASLGPSGIPQILQGSIVGQGGVIVTQPVVANGIQVSSAPMALAVTPKPQTAAKPMMQARPAAALVADKGASVVVGAVGSSSSGVSVISSSSSSGASSVISCSNNNITRNTSIITIAGGNNSSSSGSNTVTNTSSNTVSNIGSNIGSNTVSNTVSNNASNNSKNNSNNNSTASCTNSTGSSSSSSNNSSSNSGNSNDSSVGSNSSKAADSQPPVVSTSHSSRTLPSTFLDPSFYKNKKSQEQLSTLKQSFNRSQFPGQEEVERLTKITGLSVREVRKWFSDRRYHYRNLKGSRSAAGGPFSGNSLLDLTDSSASTESPKPNQHPQSPPPQQQTSPPTPSRRAPRQQTPDFTAIRYKERDPQQVRALEASFAQDPLPSEEEVDRLRAETKMTRREIDGWFSERRKKVAAEKKREEAERAEEDSDDVTEKDADAKCNTQDPSQATSLNQNQVKEEKQKEDAPGSKPKVSPIKINLKMLKVTESNGKTESEISHASQAGSPTTPPPSTSSHGKKTPDPFHSLKQFFTHTMWPTSQEYDELAAKSGMPRAEVVGWFGDSRYAHKNGQLKWLESYQQMAEEEKELEETKTEVLKAHLLLHGKLEEEQVKGLAESSGLSEEDVRRWFVTRAPTLSESERAEGAGSVDSAAPPPVAAATLHQDQRVKEPTEQTAGSLVSSKERTLATDAQSASTKQGTD